MTAAIAPAFPPAVQQPGEPSPDRSALGLLSTPLVSAAVAVVTFGLLPAVVWPIRWATLLDRERGFYRELAGWWRRRADPTDAKQLDEVLAVLRPRPMLVVLPWLAAAFVAAMLAVGVYLDGADSLRNVTFLGHRRWDRLLLFDSQSPMAEHLHQFWLCGLTVAYAIQFYAVRSHSRAVSELTRWANRMGRANGLPKVKNEAGRMGLSPLWWVAGAAVWYYGGWWAIPMVLAGAAQRRYADVASPRLQLALGEQAARVVSLTGGLDDAVGPAVSRFCPSPTCGLRLPAAARFCSRCGTAAAVAPAGAYANA